MKETVKIATYVQQFFQVYLRDLRNLSPRTILSYRDTVKLFLKFSAAHKCRDVVSLHLADLGPDTVLAFLADLERTRENSIATRNVRLSAIRALYGFIAQENPEAIELCAKVLGIPMKKGPEPKPDYLEEKEIEAILSSVDRTTAKGRRDYALLAYMYNTGARVSEAIDLRPKDLQLQRPCQTRIRGKGGKERVCPLLPETVALLNHLLKERKLDEHCSEVVFTNYRGESLTRSGVTYLVSKYTRRAVAKAAGLARKRIHPHTIRHTTAVHLLRSGVDINTIRGWLGHVNLSTTNRYTEVDLETKRRVIQTTHFGILGPQRKKLWMSPSKDLIRWLESF